MEQIDQALQYFKENTPDIHEHLETLKELASRCDHVTEFGFRYGASYCALLAGLRDRPGTLLRTYDIHIPPACRDFFGPIRGETQLDFIQESTIETNPIEQTDLLWIDSLHTYSQMKHELERHGDRVKKYIAAHDVITFGRRGEDGSAFGLMDAIEEFMVNNPSWSIEKLYENNNGVIILRKG